MIKLKISNFLRDAKIASAVHARVHVSRTIIRMVTFGGGNITECSYIAGFEMILREDYKSRDEVEGLIFFPKYHFKPQDTGNIP